ncbi:TolC family protein [Lyngbya aestuarii]|uniref:TolC family protein n=1 Tax=Lyngbya aestuarii TaxID=118322 RepID=UPI00403DEFB9
MSTSHHFVALGVGAAIALSCIEPSASKNLPSLTAQTVDSVSSSNAKPVVAGAQQPQPIPPLVAQAASGAAVGEDEPVPAFGEPAVIDSMESIFPISDEQIHEAGFSANDQSSQPSAASEPTEGNASSPVLPGQGSSVVESPQLENQLPTLEATETAPESQGQTQRTTDSPLESQVPTLEAPPLPPPPPAEQQPIPETPTNLPTSQQPTLTTPTTPELDFLNPSPNPLTRPNQPEQVDVETVQPITLQQALALARRNSQELQEAVLNLQRQELQLREALAARFPTASLSADLTRSDSANAELNGELQQQQENELAQQQNRPPQDIDPDTVSTSANASLQLSYSLYTSGRRPAQIRAAEEGVNLQQLELERVTEQLRLDVAEAYYNLQQADAQVDIFQAAVASSGQNLRDAQLLEQAGLGTRFEVLQQEVQLADDRQNLISAISSQRIARRTLVELLNLAPDVEVSAADPIQKAGEWQLTLPQSIVLALQNRAELQQQLVQRNINQQQRRIALADVRPQVDLIASYDVIDVFDDGVGLTDGVALQARLRWNFFDGGAARARSRQSEVDVAINETTFANARDQIRLQVERSFFQLNSNEENIATTSVAVQQAEESLRLARLRFQAGVGTQTDVINQQSALTRARSSQLTAIVEYNRALAQLQRFISNLPENNLFDLP